MERSTGLNRNFNRSACDPLRAGVPGGLSAKVLLFALLTLSISGCGTLLETRVPWERPAGCRAFFETLDAAVLGRGVRDAAQAPVGGFPYLRAGRFEASLAGRLAGGEAKAAWAEWMRGLDGAARKREIDNLPDEAVLQLAASREALFERAAACSRELFERDRVRPDFFDVLGPRVAVPDEYSAALQALGLYPLVTIPEYRITERVRERFRAWYEMPYGKLPVKGTLRVYRPPQAAGRDAAGVIAASDHNPLDVPRPSADEARELALRYAPILIQDEAAPYDRVGRVVWKGAAPTVDGERPALYYYLSHAFLKGEPVLQINYVFWYPARAGDLAPAIEHGRLDGLTLRLSFDKKGGLFMIDLMNNCGCYHVFVPDRNRVARTIARYYRNDPFAPQWLPGLGAGERYAFRILSGWHQVQRVLAAPHPGEGIPYELIPYEALESLPAGDGRRAGIFDAQGIAKGSERVERFIFYPTGIPSIGSMRQRGHHAITLSERTHFDEPDLFEKYFEFR